MFCAYTHQTASLRIRPIPSIFLAPAVTKSWVILNHFSQKFVGSVGPHSVLHPSHSSVARQMLRDHNKSRGKNLRMAHACDLMEVIVKIKHSKVMEIQDGIGEAYAELAVERDAERSKSAGEIAQKISKAIGWDWDGGLKMNRNKQGRPREKEREQKR